jgi:hypothetical protein
MNIYSKLKYVNINRKSGFLKYLSGIRKSFELYIGETEKNAELYMTSILLDESGFCKTKRYFETVMNDGVQYNISTERIPGKTFWKDTSVRIGSITHDEIEVAKMDFDGYCDRHWQTNIFWHSGEEFNIYPYQNASSFWDYHEMIYGNPKTVRVEKNKQLLLEIDDESKKIFHFSRSTKIGTIKTSNIQPELLLTVAIYYYVLYPDFIEDKTITS